MCVQMPRKMARSVRTDGFSQRRRTLELFIMSAQDLRNVDSTGKATTFAVAYVDPKYKLRTRVDNEGGSNPSWNSKLSFSIDERLFQDEAAQLTVEIHCSGTWKEKLLGRDKLVGTARILIADVVKADKSPKICPITPILIFRDSQPRGILNVCVPPTGRFPDRFNSSLSVRHR